MKKKQFKRDFDYYIDEYMYNCRSRKLRPKTMISYEQSLRLFERWLRYKDRYTSGKLLFSKKSGLPLEIHSFESGFRKYLGRAGIDKAYSPHALRNNFAKRCLMNGMDIYTLSRILGHSSVSVTENAYLDLTDRDLRHRYQNFSPMENLPTQAPTIWRYF